MHGWLLVEEKFNTAFPISPEDLAKKIQRPFESYVKAGRFLFHAPLRKKLKWREIPKRGIFFHILPLDSMANKTMCNPLSSASSFTTTYYYVVLHRGRNFF